MIDHKIEKIIKKDDFILILILLILKNRIKNLSIFSKD